MKKKLKVILTIILFILILIVLSLILKKFNKKKEISLELTNIIEVNDTNFEEEVLKSKKTVLVDFYATWCGPCKTLKPIIEEISKENEKIKIVEIDVDKNNNLVRKYNIQAMPTIIVFKDGEEITRNIGAIPKEEILNMLGN